MLTKGIIKKIPANNLNNTDYKFDVRIPLFEEAGSTTEFILKSCLCYNESEAYFYKVNDIVYVAFENNNLDKPIILGKLFCDKNIKNETVEENSTYIDPRKIKELENNINNTKVYKHDLTIKTLLVNIYATIVLYSSSSTPINTFDKLKDFVGGYDILFNTMFCCYNSLIGGEYMHSFKLQENNMLIAYNILDESTSLEVYEIVDNVLPK